MRDQERQAVPAEGCCSALVVANATALMDAKRARAAVYLREQLGIRLHASGGGRGGADYPEAARRGGRGAGRTPKPTKPTKRRGTPTHLLVTEGSNAGERVDLERAPILIGRGADAAIRLDDDYVSTRHARIAASGDQWFVEDLGSTNGTYVGTVRITQPTTITLGTQVRIGKTLLELRK